MIEHEFQQRRHVHPRIRGVPNRQALNDFDHEVDRTNYELFRKKRFAISIMTIDKFQVNYPE